MTNEGKAIQIYNDLSHKWDSLHYGYITKALMEMAEWKDNQFKEYLEKKLMDIRKENSCGPHGVGYNQGKQRIINEIINELFGEDRV